MPSEKSQRSVVLKPAPPWVADAMDLKAQGMSLAAISKKLHVGLGTVWWQLMPPEDRIARLKARATTRKARRIRTTVRADVTTGNADIPEVWVKRPTRRIIDRAALNAALADRSLASMPVDEIMRRITP